MKRGHFAAATILALALAGCASVDPYARPPISDHLARDDDRGRCARLLREIDAAVDAAGVRDAGAPRVAGFPYLRVDRHTASLAAKAGELRGAGFSAWSELMAQADRQARAAELANAGVEGRAAAVDGCRFALAVADSGEFERLREAAQVPDNYSTAARVFGLYPLTRLGFAAGIRQWHRQTLEVFAKPVESLPQEGRLRLVVPAAQIEPVLPPRSAVMGLPAVSRVDLALWIERHAPALQIDTASDDDRIGSLHWSAAGAPIAVDLQRPAAYVRTAYTRFGGRTRLQLGYTFWFPARPPQHDFDVLAGHLDGLIWRVTLDDAGNALVYDSIHACGCWHQFFPTAAVVARPQPQSLDEGLFVPQSAPQPAAGQRLVLRLEAQTHFLQRLQLQPAGAPGDDRYALRDERELLTLPLPGGGSRSAYDSAGFVAGTERAERWLYWPMGIASAGQMRQWGRHATAFVGRRHFDDADLLDMYFELRAPLAAGRHP